MNLARPQFQRNEEAARLAVHRVDEAAGLTKQVQPPGYGEPQRDAIASIVDGVVQDVIESIKALQSRLQALEDQVLVGAATAKDTLNKQVEVCSRVREQTAQIASAVDEIAQKVLRL